MPWKRRPDAVMGVLGIEAGKRGALVVAMAAKLCICG